MWDPTDKTQIIGVDSMSIYPLRHTTSLCPNCKCSVFVIKLPWCFSQGMEECSQENRRFLIHLIFDYIWVVVPLKSFTVTELSHQPQFSCLTWICDPQFKLLCLSAEVSWTTSQNTLYLVLLAIWNITVREEEVLS